MTSVVPQFALCVCGFRGVLPSRGRCPSCGRSSNDRITPVRFAALVGLHGRRADARPMHVQPAVRAWLLGHRLICHDPSQPRRTLGSGDGRFPSRWRYVLTREAVGVLADYLEDPRKFDEDRKSVGAARAVESLGRSA